MCLLTNKFKSFKNVYFPQPIFPPTSCHGQMIDIFFLSGLMSGLHETYALGAERRRLLKRHRTSGSSYNHQERLLAFDNSESPVIEKKNGKCCCAGSRPASCRHWTSRPFSCWTLLHAIPCWRRRVAGQARDRTTDEVWAGDVHYFFFMIIFTPSVWRIMATQAMLTNTLTLLYVYRRRRKYNKQFALFLTTFQIINGWNIRLVRLWF